MLKKQQNYALWMGHHLHPSIHEEIKVQTTTLSMDMRDLTTLDKMKMGRQEEIMDVSQLAVSGDNKCDKCDGKYVFKHILAWPQPSHRYYWCLRPYFKVTNFMVCVQTHLGYGLALAFWGVQPHFKAKNINVKTHFGYGQLVICLCPLYKAKHFTLKLQYYNWKI